MTGFTPILGIPETSPTQTDKTTTMNDGLVALEAANNAQAIIDFTAGDVTLTTTQWTRNIIFTASNVSGDQNLVVPLTLRLFAVRNPSAHTINVGGISGATVAVLTGTGAIIQCDGTNCWLFGSGGSGAIGLTGQPGGAVSISYLFNASTTPADPGASHLLLNDATQNAATGVYVSDTDTFGSDWAAVLDTLDDSTSTDKGTLRLFNEADPSKWIVFTVTGLSSFSTYRALAVTEVGSSSASPFSAGNSIVLTFDRTGDKGVTGPAPSPAGMVATDGTVALTATLSGDFNYTTGTLTLTSAVEHTANKNAASGYAGLNGSGYVSFAQLPPSLSEATFFVGTVNGATMVTSTSGTISSGTLTAGSATLEAGMMFKISTAGTTTVDGISQWNVGDQIVYSGISDTWLKIGGLSSEVLSVGGTVGAIGVGGNLAMSGTTIVVVPTPTIEGALITNTFSASATHPLKIIDSGSSGTLAPMAATQGNSLAQIVPADGVNPILEMAAFGTGVWGSFVLRAAEGTRASPSAVSSGDTLGEYSFVGYDGTAWPSFSARHGKFQFVATESWNSGAHGYAAQIVVGNTGTTTTSVYNFQDGNLAIPGTTLTVAGGSVELQANKGVALGYAGLDADGFVPLDQMQPEITYTDLAIPFPGKPPQFTSGPPATGRVTVLLRQALVLPANMLDSSMGFITAATGTPAFIVSSWHTGTITARGTLTINSGGTVSISGAGTLDVTLEPQDMLICDPPATPDATLSDGCVTVRMWKVAG